MTNANRIDSAMKLFLLRHGDAARIASNDRERPLTARGRDELRETLEQCVEALEAVTHMLVSPYLRARQSAEIASRWLPAAVIQESWDSLVPEADPRQLMDRLQQRQQRDAGFKPLLVTHQPLIGTFVDRLCGFETGRYRIGTSALACVSAEVVAADMGQLIWLKQPEDFR